MLIDNKSINWCLGRVEEILHIYKLHYLNAGNSIRSVNDLLDLCRKYLEKKIDLYIHQDSHIAHGVKGFLVTLDDGYEICLLDELNNCWKRFVLCKELFHVILDEEKYWNTSLIDHIEDFAAGAVNVDRKVCDSAKAEKLAEIAAMEFLFPYSDRKAILEKGGPINFMAIAEQYKVPRLYAEWYLTDRMMEALNPENLAK